MNEKKIIAILVVLAICVFMNNPINAQMIAEIKENIQTDFGLYQPIPVDFTPSVPAINVESDFSNVANFSMIEWMLNSTDSTLLLQNHFTVKKSRYKQLYDIYNDLYTIMYHVTIPTGLVFAVLLILHFFQYL